ncbi:sugar transporter [Neptunitalea chrysea]|uniref:Sugar transporter n=2 Tax=Neptunitalea chrysea TaxID=1647581 RepID=A0A9W6B686_9FLAO|nr:sugar transporter [Neptunitalea chrysea]
MVITQVAKPYRVQVNDLISITLKADNSDLVQMFNKRENTNQQQTVSEANLYMNGYVVDEHGNIRIPVLEEVNVLGYTTEEIRKKVESLLYEKYLKEEVQLFVSVKLAGLSYTTTGQVNNPGRVTVFKDKLNIVEALALAGDINDVADRGDVVIVRQYPGGSRIHHIDLTNVNAMLSPYYYIKPNDMIIVNPLPQKSIGTGTNGLQTFTTIFSVFSVITSSILLIRTL